MSPIYAIGSVPKRNLWKFFFGKYQHLSLMLRLELFKREKKMKLLMSSYLNELLRKIKKTNKSIKKSIRISNLQHSPPERVVMTPWHNYKKHFNSAKVAITLFKKKQCIETRKSTLPDWFVHLLTWLPPLHHWKYNT